MAWNDENFDTQEENEVTLIQKNTKIEGDITTNNDMVVYGSIVGNINCEGNLKVYGEVQGNITCHDASFMEAAIEGDITCHKQLEISQNSVINGNITAVNLISGGKIKGDVVVEEYSFLKPTSKLQGNITSLEIEIGRGALVIGAVKVSEKVDF